MVPHAEAVNFMPRLTGAASPSGVVLGRSVAENRLTPVAGGGATVRLTLADAVPPLPSEIV